MRSIQGAVEWDGAVAEWGWYEYRPFGGDVWHGGYRTRAAARRARRAVLEAHGAGYWADVWRAGRVEA